MRVLRGKIRVRFRFGCGRSALNVVPQEVAELIDRFPEIFNQLAVKQTVENLRLLTGTGVLKSTPLHLRQESPEFLGNSCNAVRSVPHHLSPFLLGFETL